MWFFDISEMVKYKFNLTFGQKQWHSIVALDHGIELWLESWHSWLLPLSFEYCVEISIIE